MNIFVNFDKNCIILNGKIKFRYICIIIYKEIVRLLVLNKVIMMKSWVCKIYLLLCYEECIFYCINIF